MDAFKLQVSARQVALDVARVPDPTVGNALLFRHLGARLASDFTSNGVDDRGVVRTLTLDNADRWPSGNFHFILTKLNDGGQDPATLLYCLSRAGNVLTVRYEPYALSAFNDSPTFTSRVIGDCAGSGSGTWVRPFSALSGADNGRGIDDPAASGNVPVRSRIVGNPAYVPQSPALLGYGYYGHADYHDDPRFNPWVPGSQASWMAGDGVARSDPFDGNEFWLQFRLWVDPVYWQEHVLPNPANQNFWGRKVWMLQTETTVPQQLTAGVAPTNIYTIPSTNEAPFALAKFTSSGGSASAVLTEHPYSTNGSSYQPGSFDPVTGKSWAATARHAISGLPADGQNTPDGNSAWEYRSGEWLTFLVHMKPGKAWNNSLGLREAWASETQSTLTLIDAPDDWPTNAFQIAHGSSVFNVASRNGAVLSGITLASGPHVALPHGTGIFKTPNTPAGTAAQSTLLEVFVAHEGDSQYTTLLSVDDYPIQFGSNGQYAGWYNGALPGYQAIAFTGYLNQDLSQFTAPARTYDIKVGEVIFSRSHIPPPSPLS